MSFRRFFIPVDGSKNALEACEMAVRLAEMGEEKVILAHCHDAIPDRVQGHPRDELMLDLQKKAEDIFAKCTPIFEKGKIPVETIILFGSQGPTLAEAADEHKCDLIIMGTKGHSNLGNLFLGSVSTAVIHNTQLPVMLVPEKF